MQGLEETGLVQEILAEIERDRTERAIAGLRTLQASIYAGIPANLRSGRGVTWVAERISALFAQVCPDEDRYLNVAKLLFAHLEKGDRLLGAPLFMLAAYGQQHPQKVLAGF